jgi:hypothetical protein
VTSAHRLSEHGHRGDRPDVVGLSNTWSATSAELDHAEMLAVVGALHPGSSVTDFSEGDTWTRWWLPAM